MQQQHEGILIRDGTEGWREIRCQRSYKGKTCNRIIARGRLEVCEIEIQCERCRKYTILRASRPNLAPLDGLCGDRHALSHTAPR